MMDFFEIVKKRLSNIIIESKEHYNNELCEITQELILSGLAENNEFFKNNIFHGGTALRLIYDLNRYSGDLDFNMKEKRDDFSWEPYFEYLEKYTERAGCALTFKNDKRVEHAIKRSYAFNDILGDMIREAKIIDTKWTKKDGNVKRIKIKIETSFQTNNFISEEKCLSFPQKYTVNVFNIHSLFSGKLHALLARGVDDKTMNETKYINAGRDWFDLIWYVNKGIEPDYAYFQQKITDKGPWKGQGINTDINWIKEQLMNKIKIMDYEKLNDELIPYTNKDNRIILNEKLLLNTIHNFGKDG